MLGNTIQSIMNTDIAYLPARSSMKEAVRMMTSKKIGCLIINDKKRKPIGIITERDVLRLAAEDNDINKITVDEVMSSPLSTVSRTMDIYEAAIYLEKHHFRNIVITDNTGKLLGLVTQTDLKAHLGSVYYVKLKKIKSIMVREVITADSNDNLLDLTRRMSEKNIGCLVICRGNRPLGIITERDVTRLMANKEHCGKLLAKEIFKSPLITITENTPIYEATRIMQAKNIRRLVVTDGKKDLLGLITESNIVKHLETDYLESLRSIVESDRIYINTIKDGLFECSTGQDGIFTWTNLAGARILGYRSPQRIVGKKVGDIFSDPHDQEKLFNHLKTKGEVKDFDAVLKKANERTFYAEISLYYIKDEQNNLSCIEGIIRDVTERKKMEDRVKTYSVKLEQKVKEKTAKIRKQNRELKRINTKLHKLTIHDGLTGIKNFRYFSHILDAEYKKAMRYKLPLSCIIIDIDDFKLINDNFGHIIGDYALIRTARLLEKIIRETDIVSRYGGDEFALILPNTDFKDAKLVGEKILESFRKYRLKKGSRALGKISVSVGVSTLPDKKIKKAQDLAERADKAMYLAKECGKNNISSCREID